MFEDLSKHTGKRSMTSDLLIMILFVVGLFLGLAAFDAMVRWAL